MKKLPKPKKEHWLFGNAYYLRENTIQNISNFIDECGPILSISALFRKIVIVSHPDYIKQILQDNSQNYRKSLAYDILARLLGNGILISTGETWKRHRKLIQPAFHKKKLDDFVHVMYRCTDTALHSLASKKSLNQIDLSPFFNSLALDIISQCMFGTEVDKHASRISEIIKQLNLYAIERINKPITSFLFRRNNDIPLIKELDSYIYEIIQRRRTSGIKRDDLLQMLLDAKDEENGIGMDDIQIRDELMTIFVAGHETTACAMNWIIYALGKNQECLEKLRIECENATVNFDYDSLFAQPYLRMCIDETLRMYPPAWTMGRRNNVEEKFGDYPIEPDTNILIPIHYMHYHKAYWDNPEQFNPERFNPAHKNTINRFVYLPFGAGSRMCIGNNFALLEMMVIVKLFIQRFNFQICEGFIATPEPLITLHSKEGMYVNLQVK